ncbi:unnamed protein product [Parascedosporium putredinis]|uniref:Uncharacterized protein n=1 Tax=Parascedosporium putredinis TaxID=1442378 RepID=A0A9P1HAB9_9PEZI|nr:unnamed protein product [Parascedosporium putredinis]CAI8001034.1 unnamed protein product [Parascedosporium putredinis]
MQLKSLFTFLLAGYAAAAPASTGLEVRDPSVLESRAVTKVEFSSITASGTGCPSGSYTVTISTNRDVGTIAFRSYNTAFGATTTKSCTVVLNLIYPSGCTSGSLQSNYHGFVQVASGATGTVNAAYTSSTGNSANPSNSIFSGAVWAPGNPWSRIDIAPAKVINRSANDAAVTARAATTLTLTRTNNSAGGTLIADDITFSIINQSRNTNWQTCTV